MTTQETFSTDTISNRELRSAFETSRDHLLSRRAGEGHWVGRLSSSALATATAVSALSVVADPRHRVLIAEGKRWLCCNQNADGGWGDTPESPSNVPTTLLVEAALCLGSGESLDGAADSIEKAESYLARRAGESPEERTRTLRRLYGKDRTFAVPILANCALTRTAAGGEKKDFVPHGLRFNWEDIPRLPYELGCLPHSWLQMADLHVVSYALPALIAIGQLIDHQKSEVGVLRTVAQWMVRRPTLRRLRKIQPENGGFLEAVPLTGFVTMSLAAMGRKDHRVCRKGLEFIESSRREDGSWPIDTNLSCWLTTMSVRALDAGGYTFGGEGEMMRQWILTQQQTEMHPYTQSPSGGWAWTDLPGGVPDVDDTASALIALSVLEDGTMGSPAQEGVRWLLLLQNEDGGWPTFCRGWGRLPFDRSAPDLTAHVLRALNAWNRLIDPEEAEEAWDAGLRFLRHSQRKDGSWVPLWFGNQFATRKENPVYGTARVLTAYRDLGMDDAEEAERGREFLLDAQNPDGSWGGAPGVQGTMEETALAVEALAHRTDEGPETRACLAGARYLADGIEAGRLEDAAPVGLYFAQLWYSEELYPSIWTTSALGHVLRCRDGRFSEQRAAAMSTRTGGRI